MTRYAKQQLDFFRDLAWHGTIGHAHDWLALSMLSDEAARRRAGLPRPTEGEGMNVDELLSGARDAITVRRVFGDPIEQDGVVVIPAAAVGGGGGGGGDNEDNGGGGFGLRARPVGAYVIKDGEVTWKPAIDAAGALGWRSSPVSPRSRSGVRAAATEAAAARRPSTQSAR